MYHSFQCQTFYRDNDIMYQSRVNQNPLINRYNQYRETVHVPFTSNKLINSDPRMVSVTHSGEKVSTENIIEKILTPVKVKNDALDDVALSYEAKMKLREQQEKTIEYIDTPYKAIIKQAFNKPLDKIKQQDLIVHKVTEADKETERFNKDLKTKELTRNNEDTALEIEFSPSNYNKHKKVFEYNESFITNMAYEENLFDDNKRDCIAFYQEKQKELEKGKAMCDEVLRSLMDRGVISQDEIPS